MATVLSLCIVDFSVAVNNIKAMSIAMEKKRIGFLRTVLELRSISSKYKQYRHF
jgi:hypothetical protein